MRKMPAIEVDQAYGRCEQITRQEAANFFYGIRLLPRAKRQAMSAVYAFARRVDDIGDGELDRARQMEALARERRLLGGLAAGGPGDPADPVSVALGHAIPLYALPVGALESLIEGVELDVLGTSFDTFDELVAYCRHVAGSIGRLCLAIFSGPAGPQRPAGPDGTAHAGPGAMELADDLGVAMQLTNILRDVREDRERGRVYLPAEDLRRFGAPTLNELSGEQAGQLIRFEADRAAAWFDRGLALVEHLDRRSASCVLAMTGIYRCILERITLEPAAVFERRVSLPAWEKAWVAARSLSGRPVRGGYG
ncbi:MAG TPA: squalene/phytoene synthase family protein [Solirubrobacteraceae bacterium]|nr:squalene/phytoene synthase family protein [Solirubrobacteraceae bacterium]